MNRLNLLPVSVMEALAIGRLLTNDRARGVAASALGVTVISPQPGA